MKKQPAVVSPQNPACISTRLAAYLTAVGAGTTLGSAAEGAIVGNATVQPFGVNGVVSIDFNSDGQTDFQIDHDRVNLNGTNLDYLQIDKNDVNGESNPLAFDPITGFQAATFTDGATSRNDANQAGYVIDPNQQGSYPAAMTFGTPIGPSSSFDWQESENFQNSGKAIRANRLLDEDATQIDQVLGGKSPSQVQVPFNGPTFDALGGAIRYLGLKMELNNANQTNYGWIGVRIDNEADATGAVVGYAYETTPSMPIPAGVVPEPGSMMLAAAGAVALLGAAARRRAKQSFIAGRKIINSI
jgi:hypothetical protein